MFDWYKQMNSTKFTSVAGTHINSIASKLMEKHQQKPLGSTSLQRNVTMPEVPIDPREEKRKISDEGLFTSGCREKRCKKAIPKKWISDRKKSGLQNQDNLTSPAKPMTRLILMAKKSKGRRISRSSQKGFVKGHLENTNAICVLIMENIRQNIRMIKLSIVLCRVVINRLTICIS